MLYWTHSNQTKVPKLGFGTWLMKGSHCITSVRSALDIGYRHIDTAQIYENESEVGKAIFKSTICRKEIFLTTKIWRDSLKTQEVIQSTEVSLKKLQTDYVDLLLIHWPNDQVPLQETLLALQKLVTQQKTKFIGVSNFPIELLNTAKKIAPEIICNQIEYHPFLDQRPILKSIKQHNMFLTAYSPLARKKVFKNKTLIELAQKYSKTAGQLVLRWLIEKNSVIAIPKAGNLEHIKSNFDIFNFKLQKSDQDILESMHKQKHRLINPDWAPKWD